MQGIANTCPYLPIVANTGQCTALGINHNLHGKPRFINTYNVCQSLQHHFLVGYLEIWSILATNLCQYWQYVCQCLPILVNVCLCWSMLATFGFFCQCWLILTNCGQYVPQCTRARSCRPAYCNVSWNLPMLGSFLAMLVSASNCYHC